MNHESIDLEPLCVERVQVKEVLKALIHSIIFQRALGAPLYRDTESDLFDITYMRCDSHLIDSKVEELAEAFSSGIDADAAADVRTTCCLSFFERRSSSAAFGWLRSEERVVWERWNIPLVVRRAELPSALLGGGDAAAAAATAADAERAARHNALRPPADRVRPLRRERKARAHPARRRPRRRHDLVRDLVDERRRGVERAGHDAPAALEREPAHRRRAQISV